MTPLEKMKFRIVGIVTKEFEYGDTKHPTTFKPDAYVFSTAADTFYCCGKHLTRSQVDEFIAEGAIQSCFAVKPEFVDASIFHDYTVMDLYPYTCIEYWNERGISQEEIDEAIDVFMMTMNMVVGTYELSIRDFNFFLFGMLMGKKPSIFDGVQDIEQAVSTLDEYLKNSEAIRKALEAYAKELLKKQQQNSD